MFLTAIAGNWYITADLVGSDFAFSQAATIFRMALLLYTVLIPLVGAASEVLALPAPALGPIVRRGLRRRI